MLTACVLVALALTGSALAGDLYRVEVSSAKEATVLAGLGVQPVAALPGAYLVICDEMAVNRLAQSGLMSRFVANDLTTEQLAVDNRLDRTNVRRYPLVYEEGNFRMYRIQPADLLDQGAELGLRPLRGDAVKILAPEPKIMADATRAMASPSDVPLDSLISRISQDTLTASVFKLQSFYRRLNGTDSNRVARDWIASALQSYGYDSVVFDSFTVSGITMPCENVLAYKVGTRFPNHYVIVGAHRDGVAVSPAADDNGSGTAGVLEVARALANVETDMTFVFALFDAEESGLNGSYHYTDEAYARGDSIVYMFNMDMIAQYTNSTQANLYHGSLTGFSSLCIQLLDSLCGITGYLAGASGGSDHYPFVQRGWEATFLAEYDFSTVYHSARDSTTYMNFEYMTRMVKGALATVYTVSQTAGPIPSVVLAYPGGVPQMLAPQTASSFDVTVTGSYDGIPVPGSGRLHYSLDGGAWVSVPMVEGAPGQYTATLPPAPCFGRYLFYSSADETTNGTFYNPDPSKPYEAVVATSTSYAYEDQFEVATGWVVTGTATAGQWARGVPVGGGDMADPPTAYGGSGACYLTGNIDGNSDVDGGTTILTSPVFAVNADDARVSYARWYSNTYGAAPNEDVFRVYMSANNGLSWTVVDSAGPVQDASGGWILHSFWISQFMTPTQLMKIRFEASDLGSGSYVEAAVDALTLTTFECLAPYICGDCNDDSVGPDIGDLTYLVEYLFFGGPAPVEMGAANIDGVGTVDIGDLSYLVDYLFFSGPAPVC
ncbi:MAG: M28 family peptidase [Candidatus Zixiibacteriota bacterium]